MDNIQTHYSIQNGSEGLVDLYILAPSISISFNQIHTGSWSKGDSTLFSDHMLILNFCIRGRCDASLRGHQYCIVKEGDVCISTILPERDFYYPGRLYEGIQINIDLNILNQEGTDTLLSSMGIDAEALESSFCHKDGLYLHQMDDILLSLINNMWQEKDTVDEGKLRYHAVRLLYQVMELPRNSETQKYFTQSQIAIVKEAEALILDDLSKRITAREMADRFGISESSFKLYVKGILGEGYLPYFRRKRMEKAAELLRSSNLKIIEIASAVGYENQSKFAKAFASQYGSTPLEYRRMTRIEKAMRNLF